MIPHRTPFFLPYIYPSLTWRLTPSEKKLYLTFDDGPVPGPTDYVLNELSRRNAKATFFCIGDNVRKHPSLLRSIITAGHAIGNHTFNHLNGWRTADDLYLDNIRKCDEEIAQHTGNTSALFRPPYGKIRFSQIRKLRSHKIIMWDVLTKDYDRTFNPSVILQRSINASRYGSVVVLHDSMKADGNVRKVLSPFMDHFASLGYTFCAIPTS